jgi:3-oxoacid CoA-transferase
MPAAGKVYESAEAAIADLNDGASVCVGGFGPPHNRPASLLKALAEKGPTGLTLIANTFSYQGLAENEQVVKFIGAFGSSAYQRDSAADRMIAAGRLEFEACPQGILTERLRAGAAGIPAFYSPVGVDTIVAEGKERREFGGREHVLETALQPDFAFVKAARADELGNLAYVGATRNFHPTMAAAARVTIAEVDEIVPVGAIAPQDVVVPSIYVNRIVRTAATPEELAALRRPSSTRGPTLGHAREQDTHPHLSHELMAMRVARLLQRGQVVNLGLGLPTLVANYVDHSSGVLFHAENGLLGYGPFPADGQADTTVYNAGGQPVTLFPGASFFTSLDAFTMARGGYVDVVILGAFQVSQYGDVANWWAPYMVRGGIGGAMDLIAGGHSLIIMMDHVTREGAPRILKECTYPLTGTRCVTTLMTDLALIDISAEGLLLRETAPGVSPDDVQKLTDAELSIAPDCAPMQF